MPSICLKLPPALDPRPIVLTDTTSFNDRTDIAFESLGVRIRVSTDAPEVLDRVPAILPPDAQPCPPSTADGTYEIRSRPGGGYDFLLDGSPVSERIELPLALTLLEGQLQVYVGLHAPNRIFVHAGVVGYEGRAIVVPGRSFAGKTTLTLALVRAGAVYYSDEFAVLDERGLVHPYARPVSVRDGGEAQTDHHIERFGGVVGVEPLEVGTVVFAQYRPGAEWDPTEIAPAKGALSMFENALPALSRSEESMRAIKQAVRGALLLEGDRGEADVVARSLLARLSA
jgi:hypothetical protein